MAGIVYRSANNGCYHAGIYYPPGELLPEMPVACLNVHLGGGNVEMVESTPEPTPEEIVEVIDQILEEENAESL